MGASRRGSVRCSAISRKGLGLPPDIWIRVEEVLGFLLSSGVYRAGNAAMSLGFDSFLRRRVLAMPKGVVLDVGCGDGYYARLLEARGAEVVCLDPLAGHLSVKEVSHFVAGVAEHLPFRSRSVDYSLAMFSLRDFLDKAKGLHEMKRVSRRAVIILDIFNPRNPLARFLLWLYVAAVAPLLAFMASRTRSPWRLLLPTLMYMPSVDLLRRLHGKVPYCVAWCALAVVVLPAGEEQPLGYV